jgi:protein-tyrosine-phosphatase
MAQAIFAAEAARRGLQVEVTSAGVWDFDGELAAEEARLTCDKRNTPMPKFVATHIQKVAFSKVVRVFVMEHSHVAALLAETSLAPERVTLLGQYDPQHRGAEIEDPIGKDRAAFERCYDRLKDCILHYLDTTDDFKV